MSDLNLLINAVFILTVALSIFIFYKASHSRLLAVVIPVWCIVHSALAFSGFYLNEMTVPPRMLFLVGPVFITIALFFILKRGRKFIDQIDLKFLLLLHVLRIPVELVMNASYQNGSLPEIMTFHGNNFDILSGISAIVMYYLFYIKKVAGRRSLIIWNFVCLGILLNIMILGIFSVETQFQKFGFGQPNAAMLHFPLILLPGCVAPLVLFSHLISLRKLLLEPNTSGVAIEPEGVSHATGMENQKAKC